MKRLFLAVFVLFVVPAAAVQSPAQSTPAPAEEDYYLVSESGLAKIQQALSAQAAEIERLKDLMAKGKCL